MRKHGNQPSEIEFSRCNGYKLMKRELDSPSDHTLVFMDRYQVEVESGREFHVMRGREKKLVSLGRELIANKKRGKDVRLRTSRVERNQSVYESRIEKSGIQTQ